MKTRLDIERNGDRDAAANRPSMPPVAFPGPVPLSGLEGRGRQRPSVEELLDVFESHISSEAESLGEYQRLARATDDPVIGLLTELILDDEERHHGLLYRMAATLRDDLYWTHSQDALSTSGARVDPDLAAGLRSRVQQGIREERSGARFLRQLAREEGDLYGGVFALLLEVMAMDSEKHERILRFVERRLKKVGR